MSRHLDVRFIVVFYIVQSRQRVAKVIINYLLAHFDNMRRIGPSRRRHLSYWGLLTKCMSLPQAFTMHNYVFYR